MENNINTEQKISTPMAIIVAGVLIMIGIMVTRGGSYTPGVKTLSEQVGVSKQALTACIGKLDVDTLGTSIDNSVNKAMSHIPKERRGTPYSIVIGTNGLMTEIMGAESYENVSTIVKSTEDGKLAIDLSDPSKTITINYKGNVNLVESDDHILGNPNAKVTIIEYSDYECPFCKQFHPTLERIVKESEGNVKWIYRHYPLHQNSFSKLVAAECVAKIKGNDAFWKYSDLLFGLLKTGSDSVSEQL